MIGAMSMKAYRKRILKATRESGPETRNMLHARSWTVLEALGFEALLADMLKKRELRMYGKGKGARYGAPGWRGLR